MLIMAGPEPLTVLLVVLIAFGTAMLHSVSGFGGGLLLAICLAPILGVKETVPVTAVAMLVSNVSRLWLFRRAVEWRMVTTILLCALPGIVTGAVVYVRLPVHGVAAVLGVFLLVTVALRHAAVLRSRRPGLRGLGLVAVPFGFISGTTFGAGMMLVPFMLSAGLVGEQFVAVAAAIGVGLNVTKAIIFGFSPLLTGALAVTGLLIGLAMIPGTYTGRWIVRRSRIKVHGAFMDFVVAGGAAYFFWVAARGLGFV